MSILSKIQTGDSMNMNNKRLFIAKIWLTSTVVLFALIIAQVLWLAVVSNNNRLANDINTKLKSSVKINSQKIATGNSEGKDVYVQNNFKKLFTFDEIMKISSGFWSYQLLVDGKTVTDTKITASTGNLTVTIIQKETERVLPETFHVMGMLTGGDKSDNYYDHITVSNATMTKSSQNGISTAVYTIKNVKVGQTIPLIITEPLKTKLGLKGIDLTISVK